MKSWIGTFMVAFVFVSLALAELRPRTPEELTEQATNIVTGRVLACYSRDVETELDGKGTIQTKSV
jgi:hypothetical protein